MCLHKLLFGLLHLLVAVEFFVSCQGGSRSVSLLGASGDTIPMKYARLLTMIRHDGFLEVTLTNPWKKGTELHRYILVPKGKVGDATVEQLKNEYGLENGRIDVVRTPVESSVVFTSPHCQLMYDLGCQKAITGVCDLAYINISDVKRRASGQSHASHLGNAIMDCGSSMQPNVERIIDLKPEALLISPFENSGGYSKLEKLNVPIIETADYMETSPLGRAEWMKFYGMLFSEKVEDEKTSPSPVGQVRHVSCEVRADSLFAQIEKEYLSLKAQAAEFPRGLSILTERKTGNVWYVPGGQSTVGVLLKDANAQYIFSSDKHSGSLALSPEQVIDKGHEVDVWAFKYFDGKPLTKNDLLREYDGYKALRAFDTQRIYECNTGAVPYFEITSFHPDILLREFILLSHPTAQGFGKLRFYQPLK